MTILADIPFEPDIDALLSGMRIEPASARGRDLSAHLEAALRLVRPKAVCDAAFVGNRQRDSVEIGGATFTSRVLRVNLDGAERVFPFIATCGREVFEHAASCEDPLLKYCLGTMMERALGAAIAFLGRWLKQEYALGETSTMNPGSLDDWPLSQQEPLFSLFGDVEALIGVELTDSFLMVPVKSVSGIIFPTEIRFESCQLCPRENCPGRRAKHQPELWGERYHST